ncbi:MAG: hypothetical protein N2Z60_09935, partial [Elusimicrobiales bacterium]|nr:hypothetical protein [Elusimicrobiales bacterium]
MCIRDSSRFMETNEEEQESIIIEEPHKEENIYFINTKQRIRKEMEDNSEQVANVIKIWQQED